MPYVPYKYMTRGQKRAASRRKYNGNRRYNNYNRYRRRY